jgi:ADP-heptose:LPS heptosyltransferase
MKENILIYRLGSLGDTLVALPCFNQVRRSFPDAHITLLTNRPVTKKAAPIEAILGPGNFFDSVIDYPLGTRNPIRILKMLFQLRSRGISKLIYLTVARSPKSVRRDVIFFKLAGIREIIGTPFTHDDFNVKQLATGLYECETLRLANRIHSLGPLDLDDHALWDLHPTKGELLEASQWVVGLNTQQPTLAVSLGTKVQSKDWGEPNWGELMTALSRQFPEWNLVLLGSAEESPTSERCISSWTGKVLNLCGKTSPRVGIAVLKHCSLFLGHDSGPMHMAANCGIPCVAIFAARNHPGHWFPRGANNRIIYHKTECFGCQLEICIKEQKRCITSISVPEVLEAVVSVGQSLKLVR